MAAAGVNVSKTNAYAVISPLAGVNVSKTNAYAVISPPPLAITCDSPPDGLVGAIYAHAFPATGGTGPYIFAITAGALPDGLSLDTSTGVASGTPTLAGTFSFTVQVTDSFAVTASVGCSIQIFDTLTISCDSPPDGAPGTPYSHAFPAAGGDGTYTFAIIAGTLPDGLTLDTSTGIVSGTPTGGGTSSFTIQVTDGVFNTASVPCSITILRHTATVDCSITVVGPLTVSCDNPPPATVGVVYAHAFPASGGLAPITFSSTGTLPPGLVLDPSTGILYGVPTGNPATYSFTIVATDTLGTIATVGCSIVAANPPVLKYTHLWRDDEWAASSFLPEWMTTPGLPTPVTWSVAVTQPYTLQLMPPPGNAGELDLLAIARGAALDPMAAPEGTPLGIPDNYFWAVKWGALADLLSQEGPGRDLERAAYCEQRYQEAVALCKAMPTVISASVNNNSTLLDSVFGFDAN